jgi:RNA methyltransferase, TrmH family
MITSTHNPRIQWVHKLQGQPRFHQSEGVFVVEGVRLAEEALRAGWQPSLVLYTPDLSQRGLEIIRSLLPSSVEEVSPAVMKSASDTQTPQGILAVMSQRVLPLPAVLDFVLLLDAIRDPGNLGTILRTAVAAGVQGVILAPGCADAFSPKVLRSAMGAHFHLPILVLEWTEIQSLLKPGGTQPGIKIYLSEVAGSLPYTRADFRSPVALIIGGEAEGAGAEAQLLAERRIHIPMAKGVESLNAAVAAAILMFEVVRQRSP